MQKARISPNFSGFGQGSKTNAWSYFCRHTYTIDGEKQSIRFFLDADDFTLLDDFDANRELIKDKLMTANRRAGCVDDLPHLIAIGYDVVLDLNSEYAAISDMYSGGSAPTKPMEAFFGNLLERPVRRKEFPIVLCNKKANLDQLLAISTALKYPLTYVQGPPGTGKTNTIVNTILSAFFNERTVLFASYNNHPIDGVFDALTHGSTKKARGNSRSDGTESDHR